jgi:hypothetical protein
VCVQPRAFPDHKHLDARLSSGDGGAAAGGTGADDEDIGRLRSMHGLMVHQWRQLQAATDPEGNIVELQPWSGHSS